jgi:hypothetical protein
MRIKGAAVWLERSTWIGWYVIAAESLSAPRKGRMYKVVLRPHVLDESPAIAIDLIIN